MFHALVLTYLQPLDVVEQTRPAHVAWIEEEISAGRLILAGRQETGTGGVLITGDVDPGTADDLIAADPYTVAGLVSYEKLSFNASLRATGL